MKLLLLTPFLWLFSTIAATSTIEFLKNVSKSALDQILNDMDNKECKADLSLFFSDLLNMKMWALKMFDANPKIPVGILSGNYFQFGDYDLCMSINETVGSRQITGQYCSVFLMQDKTLPNKEGLHKLLETIEGTSTVKSGSFGFFPFGVCVPKSCDVETIRQTALSIQKSTNSPFNVSVMDEMCISNDYTPKKYWADFYIFLLFGGILLATVASTLYDYQFSDQGKKILRVFSLIRNGKSLFSTRKSDFEFLFGIRVFLTTWVFYAHILSVLSFLPSYNTIEMGKWGRGSHTIHLYPSVFSVDSFFALSGLLVAYQYLGSSEKQNIKLSHFYLFRFVRIFPVLFAVVLFHIGPFKYFGEGPFWPMVTKKIADDCARSWWTTLTFTSNWVVNDDCIGESWSLSVDTQFYAMAPFVLMILKKNPKVAIKGMIIVTILSMVYTYVLALRGNYSMLDMFIPNRHFKWYVYFSTFSRLPVWLMGIIAGYILHNQKKHPYELPSFVTKFLWVFSISTIMGVALLMMIFLFTEVTGPLYGFYLVIGRLFWCLSFCIIVFLMFNENQKKKKGCLNLILSHRALQFFFKLGYIIYLIHLTTLIWINGTMRHPWYFSNLALFKIVLSSYAIILIFATTIWLLVEAPFIELAKCLWPIPQIVEKKPE